jgi:hypothetical protein
VVALLIDGFWTEELNPFGPVHEYDAPVTVLAVKFKVEPAQIGPLLLAVGADGPGLIVTVALPSVPQQPLAD